MTRALSDREHDVARLVASGFTDKQICADLNLSQQRVSQIMQRIVSLWRLDPQRNIRVQIATRFSAAA